MREHGGDQGSIPITEAGGLGRIGRVIQGWSQNLGPRTPFKDNVIFQTGVRKLSGQNSLMPNPPTLSPHFAISSRTVSHLFGLSCIPMAMP